MSPYYVTLTGNRNNAGDFLIRYRGHNLLRRLRPDREIVDLNSWEAFDDAALERVNGSEALILLGGPALRTDMYPHVYPLVDDLSRITVPIVIMGAGWSSIPGHWADSRGYRFTPKTLELFRRIAADGQRIGVRDYRSLNALLMAGLDHGRMTGCPALYDEAFIGKPAPAFSQKKLRSIVFSQGVSFLRSPGADAAGRDVVTALRDRYPAAKLTVAFHHSLDAETLRVAYGRDPAFHEKQQALTRWLDAEKIAYQDISGGVEDLMQLYREADLHVGQRVHAHIFCSSVNRPSVLLTEDGRGHGLKEVLGGLVFDTYDGRTLPTVPQRILKKIGLGKPLADPYVANRRLASEVVDHLEYEDRTGCVRLSAVRQRIDAHYPTMQKFIAELP